MKILFFSALFILGLSTLQAQPGQIETKKDAEGIPVKVMFEKGETHNHPLLVIWLQDKEGNYIETLYAARSIATSKYKFGKAEKGVWQAGVHRRPAALPYWAHNRGKMAPDSLFIPHPDDPMPDAITGPTPKSNFTLKSVLPKNIETPFYVLLEINQPWDWNEYWTNARFPNDKEYKTSAQPAVVYRAKVTSRKQSEIPMKLVGRSHHSGKDGKLYKDTETLTTAKNIVKSVKLTLP